MNLQALHSKLINPPPAPEIEAPSGAFTDSSKFLDERAQHQLVSLMLPHWPCVQGSALDDSPEVHPDPRVRARARARGDSDLTAAKTSHAPQNFAQISTEYASQENLTESCCGVPPWRSPQRMPRGTTPRYTSTVSRRVSRNVYLLWNREPGCSK